MVRIERESLWKKIIKVKFRNLNKRKMILFMQTNNIQYYISMYHSNELEREFVGKFFISVVILKDWKRLILILLVVFLFFFFFSSLSFQPTVNETAIESGERNLQR